VVHSINVGHGTWCMMFGGELLWRLIRSYRLALATSHEKPDKWEM